MLLSAFAVDNAFAEEPTEKVGNKRSSLVFPVEPLAEALKTYSAASGIAVIVDSKMTAGIRSASVRATDNPEQALRDLLAGTGHAAKPVGEHAVTLVIAASRSEANPFNQTLEDIRLVPLRPNHPTPRYLDLSSSLQSAIMTTLCL